MIFELFQIHNVKPIHNVLIILIPFGTLTLENVEREKLQKFEDLDNEKSFPDATKSIFHQFWNILW